MDLFQRMEAGEFPDGTRTLRAKIDMASPNIWLRDPVLYRIRYAEHHHTGGRFATATRVCSQALLYPEVEAPVRAARASTETYSR